MIVIVDIHGKVERYLKLLARYPGEPSVQLGDFGIGFPGDEPLPPCPAMPGSCAGTTTEVASGQGLLARSSFHVQARSR